MYGGNPARTASRSRPDRLPTVRWRVQLEEPGQGDIAGPAVLDGVAYVVAIDWTTASPPSTRSTPRRGTSAGGSCSKGSPTSTPPSPAVADGLVYVAAGGSEDRALCAPSTWRRAKSAGASIPSAGSAFLPAVVDGVVYLTSGGPGSAPAVVDGIVYVGGGTSEVGPAETVLHALEAATGALRWSCRWSSVVTSRSTRRPEPSAGSLRLDPWTATAGGFPPASSTAAIVTVGSTPWMRRPARALARHDARPRLPDRGGGWCGLRRQRQRPPLCL